MMHMTKDLLSDVWRAALIPGVPEDQDTVTGAVSPIWGEGLSTLRWIPVDLYYVWTEPIHRELFISRGYLYTWLYTQLTFR